MYRVSCRFLLCLLLLSALPRMLFPQDPPPIPLPGQDSGRNSDSDQFALDMEFGGYLENTVNAEYQKVNEEGAAFNTTRARLNISGNVEPRFDFGVTLIGVLNAGTTDFNLTHYLPPDSRQEIIPGAESLFVYEIENDLYIQEAFATLYGDRYEIRVGRHKFYSGTGYAFNPIDLFNRKDPLDPTYEVDGLDAVQVAIMLPKQSELQATIRFGNDFDTVDYQLKVQTYKNGWDLGGQYTHHVRRRMDWEAMNDAEFLDEIIQSNRFNPITRDFTWRLAAVEFAGEIGKLAIHGEGGYVFVDAPDNSGTLNHAAKSHERFLVGTDYTFDSQLYLIVEYMRIGQGRSDPSDISINDRMAYLTGEVTAINRDTVFTGASYPLTDFTDIECYGIIGANDPSMILNPWITWNILPAMKFSLSVALPIGDSRSQNGEIGPGGFLRLRYSF